MPSNRSFHTRIFKHDNKIHEAFLSSQFIALTISKLKEINNKSFYHLIIILSGGVSLKPGPVWKHHLLNTTEWDIIKTKGLHLIHRNVDGLLPKLMN